MSDDAYDRFSRTRPVAVSPAADVPQPDLGAVIKTNDVGVTMVRGECQSLSVEHGSGGRHGFNYGYLLWAELMPDNARMWLYFTTHTVQVTGRNLARVYDAVLARGVTRIAAPPINRGFPVRAPDGASVIEAVEVKRVGEEKDGNV